MNAPRVQLADVASQCGVSVSTASYILSGKEGSKRFSEATRKNVIDTANKLGYVRNRAASSLKYGSTNTVILFYTPPMNRFVERYQIKASEYLRERGQLLVSVSVPNMQAGIIVDALRSGGCDGAIVACEEGTTLQLMEALPAVPVPVTLLECAEKSTVYDVVNTDVSEAIEDVLTYLEDSGAERIAFAGQSADLEEMETDPRWQAYRQHQQTRGQAPQVLFTCPPDVAAAFQTAVKVFADLQQIPDAIYCASDRTAIGIVLAAQQQGLAIPEEISIIGTGNSKEALTLQPQLSSVGMSDSSIDTVLEHFWARLTGKKQKASAIKGRWRLVLRGTTTQQTEH